MKINACTDVRNVLVRMYVFMYVIIEKRRGRWIDTKNIRHPFYTRL